MVRILKWTKITTSKVQEDFSNIFITWAAIVYNREGELLINAEGYQR